MELGSNQVGESWHLSVESDVAVSALKRDVSLQPANQPSSLCVTDV